MKDDEITELVKELIASGREGVFWDFKLTHHDNKALLIHDLLCLANALHAGPRFLIYGVDDGDLSVVGVNEVNNRRTQADLVSFLRSNSGKFEAHRTPDVSLRAIEVDGKSLDVLIIEDRPVKPYRLLEKYEHSGRRVLPSIYSRQEDANTPIDRSASGAEIEAMFRQRFRLDVPPKSRLEYLLREFKYWKTWENGIYYHEMHPEFTFSFDDGSEPTDEEWLRGEIGYYLPDGSLSSAVSFFYFGTKIGVIGYTMFDHSNKHIARPDWAPFQGGRVYFYKKGSLSLAFQEYLAAQEGRDYSKAILSTLNRRTFDIPILDEERADSLWASASDTVITDTEEQNKLFIMGMTELGAFG